MADLTEDVLVKVSTQAAEDFVDAYYTTLQASHGTIASYYVSRETLPDGTKVPNIGWNGNDYDDGPAFQTMWENEMPYTYFDVQNLDCHVINPNYLTESGKKGKQREQNISMVAMVSGTIRLKEKKEGPLRQFTESFVLVPNTEKDTKSTGKGAQKRTWLIQNQTFRFVV